MPITTSQSKPQRRFAPKHPIVFLRKTDRHHFGMVIGIVGIATLSQIVGRRLTYKELTGKTEPQP